MRNVDYINLDQAEVEIMPSGFLSLLANLTRTGIFTYQRISPDGSIEIVRQLRTSEEVFDPESLATLTGLPLTNTHPEELISPENASDFIVGMSSDQPKKILAPVQNGDTEEYIQQRLTIFDEDTIEEVQNKTKNEISLGYTCELDFEPGMYKGQNYDAIQRNIRVNHVSLVRKARGGHNCKVLIDGTETVVNLDGLMVDNFEESKNVKVFKHEGKEYKVEDDVYSLLASLQTNFDEAKELNIAAKDLNKVKQKEIDKLTAIKDDLESKLEVKNQNDSADKFNKAVKARVSLEAQGSKVLGEVNLDSLSDEEIKVKVIKKLRPNTNLDGKSDDYIQARFDMVMEDYKEESTDTSDRTKLGKRHVSEDSDDDPWALTAKARQNSWNKYKELSKRKV